MPIICAIVPPPSLTLPMDLSKSKYTSVDGIEYPVFVHNNRYITKAPKLGWVSVFRYSHLLVMSDMSDVKYLSDLSKKITRYEENFSRNLTLEQIARGKARFRAKAKARTRASASGLC